MKILILGGTKFVGRYITEALLGAGHTVTLFNRGQTNDGLFSNVERLTGNRDGGLDALKGKTWDAVIDVSGFLPRVVRDSAELLRSQVGHYIFISSISVYADMSQPITEVSPLVEWDDPQAELNNESYAGLKVWCERAVQDVYAAQACIVRPAFVLGPHDTTYRYPYWLWRASRGGRMLVPGEDDMTSGVDARDLGAFVERLTADGAAGIYNVHQPVSLLESIQLAIELSGADTQVIALPAAKANEQELFGGKLPLWLAGNELAGIRISRSVRAEQAGLRFRPLRETVADTLAWIATEEARDTWPTGLSQNEEQSLLSEIENSK